MSGAKNKAKDRQSRANAARYTAQKDKTIVNKILTNARHVVRYNDKPSRDRLAQRPKIDLSRAAKHAKSASVKALLNDLAR